MEFANSEQVLNEMEAARYIRMSRTFLAVSRMNGTRENRTPGPSYIKVGKRVMYLRRDLDTWLKQHRVEVV